MRFKVNTCFNEQLKTYINHHSFTKELAKYGIASTYHSNGSTTMLTYHVEPMIWVLRTTDLTKNECGTCCANLNTGTMNQFTNVTPTYTYVDNGIKYYYLVPDFKNGIIYHGIWSNTMADAMCIPLSALGISMKDAILKMFNRLAKVTNSPVIQLGTYALSLLTDEDKKIATDKGWTLA